MYLSNAGCTLLVPLPRQHPRQNLGGHHFLFVGQIFPIMQNYLTYRQIDACVNIDNNILKTCLINIIIHTQNDYISMIRDTKWRSVCLICHFLFIKYIHLFVFRAFIVEIIQVD
ncbi:unnamed protein product [Chrysodeixis includens]|uniref:Uncharacterized protein n=1 Tax=Chrysodeixis includens TaxID=689277 RepID=A0A9N8L0L9_CHRIL|nr:unnamed protein product [Chrysodeixis includens]